MGAADKLAEVFSQKFEMQDHLKGQFNNPSGGVSTRFEFYQDTLKMQDSGLRIYSETVTGSVCIWDFHNWNDTIALWGPGSAFTTKVQIGPSGLII